MRRIQLMEDFGVVDAGVMSAVSRTRIAAAVTSVCMLLMSATLAVAQPLPPDQWTSEAHHTLARCVVGEAGWTSRADHLAIAGVLAVRWKMRARRVPDWTFSAQIRAYCKGLRPRNATRQWVRALPYGGGPWPVDAGPNRRRWRKTLALLSDWARGDVRTPCAGATNWGGMSLQADSSRAWRAIESGQWERVECKVETLNTFFRGT